MWDTEPYQGYCKSIAYLSANQKKSSLPKGRRKPGLVQTEMRARAGCVSGATRPCNRAPIGTKRPIVNHVTKTLFIFLGCVYMS